MLRDVGEARTRDRVDGVACPVRATDITPQSIAALILHTDTRRALFDALKEEQGGVLPLHHAFEKAARHAEATPEMLRRIVEVLIEDDGEHWAADFVGHPHMPEDVLLSLCDRGLCIEAVGHLHGPRSVLAKVVAQHRYPEAIVTLALDLYRAASAPLEAFVAHLQAHAEVTWMLRALAEIDASDEAKEAAYERLLTPDSDAAAFHARHLARSAAHAPEKLASFIAKHDAALPLLLATPVEDAAKARIIETQAEASDDPLVQAALTLHRAVQQASQHDLTAGEAERLFDLGARKVWFALASNAATPRVLLERLLAVREERGAQGIRKAARATLAAKR